MPSAKTGRAWQRRSSVGVFRFAKYLQEKFVLRQFWIDKSMGKKIDDVADVPDVDIAEAGCFKYVLVEVRDRAAKYEQTKTVVRGDASCAYHGEHTRASCARKRRVALAFV